MRAVLDYLQETDEVGLVRFGQSNARPWGHRDKEGFVEAPHLALREAGKDLTILAIAGAAAGAHGQIDTQSIVTVAEQLLVNDWVNGELRMLQADYGDSVYSCLRAGHAKVLSNQAAATTFCTFDEAADTIVWLNHGRANGSQVIFFTTGSLPGLNAGQVYWVRDATRDTFKVSADPFGTAVNLAGAAGIHTCTGRAYLQVQWVSAFLPAPEAVTFITGTPGAVLHTQTLTPGSTVTFENSGGALPAALTPGTTYSVVLPIGTGYALSLSYGGALIDLADAGTGTHTVTVTSVPHLAGYVHLHDRFTSYPNVQVVTPYQPIEPGDYPVGSPSVPGVTLQSAVQSYADLALVLPFTWNEGIDGRGATGTAQVAGLVATLDGGQTIDLNLYAGGFFRIGAWKGKVVSNTTTAVTVESWIGSGAPPGAVSLPFHLHLPHWRNNPHHDSAGEGFLYPSNDMQPGGVGSLGLIYSRPRGRLSGSYVGRALDFAYVSFAIANATSSAPLAQCKTVNAGDIVVSIAAGKLRLQRASASRDPTSSLIQFEDFLRGGYTVILNGLGQTPNVDGTYRVSGILPTYGSTGSVVDLERLDTAYPAVPGAVSGTVPAGASVTRLVWKPQHRFGSLIEVAWRMSVAVGRRVVVAHLGINSSGQIAAGDNNKFGFQGKIGWRDDDLSLDWTPSGNPGGNAARLKRLLEFIAPNAVKASLGSTHAWKVLAIDAWQAEADALMAAGREIAHRSIPAFGEWLSRLLETAGLSPYPKGAKIPLHWAQVSHVPYELSGTVTDYPGYVFTGDAEGKVNLAITRYTALRGLAASIDTDDAPKLDGTTVFGTDPLHFNGKGEARNGKAAAEVLLQLVDQGFQFALGPGAIDVGNQALSIMGEAANITQLEPTPNATQGAKLVAQHLPKAKEQILQLHPWTFATRRVAAVAIDDVVSTRKFAYAVPLEMLYPVAVLDPEAPDEHQVRTQRADVDPWTRVPEAGSLEPATLPLVIETDRQGNRILRTDQENAIFVYVAGNVDFAVWDPLVRQACAYQLASLCVGGIVKGKAGAQLGQQYAQMAMALAIQAAGNNAQFQTDIRVQGKCPWLP